MYRNEKGYKLRMYCFILKTEVQIELKLTGLDDFQQCKNQKSIKMG